MSWKWVFWWRLQAVEFLCGLMISGVAVCSKSCPLVCLYWQPFRSFLHYVTLFLHSSLNHQWMDVFEGCYVAVFEVPFYKIRKSVTKSPLDECDLSYSYSKGTLITNLVAFAQAMLVFWWTFRDVYEKKFPITFSDTGKT